MFALLKSGLTPRGVGIWVLVLMAGVGLWKGLPAMLDAWTRRADAEAIRIDNQFKRLERQTEASERLHGDCEARRKGLQEAIEGLARQRRQMQISAVRLGADEPPTITATLLAELDRLRVEISGHDDHARLRPRLHHPLGRRPVAQSR